LQPSGPKTCAAHPGATRGHCTPAAALPRFGGAAKTLGAVLALTPSVRQPSTLLHAPRGVPGARRSTAAGNGTGPGAHAVQQKYLARETAALFTPARDSSLRPAPIRPRRPAMADLQFTKRTVSSSTFEFVYYI